MAIANGVTFARDQAITLDFAGSTATKGADFTVSPESLTLLAGAGSAEATVTAVDDTDEEPAETVAVAAQHEGAAVGAASVTIAASDAPAEEGGSEPKGFALVANSNPAGIWSDGETLWVAEFSEQTIHAYRLSDGERGGRTGHRAGEEESLAGGDLVGRGDRCGWRTGVAASTPTGWRTAGGWRRGRSTRRRPGTTMRRGCGRTGRRCG